MRRQPDSPAPAARPGLDIEIDDAAGSVRVRDPRAFREGRRAFCRRLVEAAARQPGVGKAEVDLSTASCRIEFAGPRSADRRAMAGAFIAAVRNASRTGRGRDVWPAVAGGWSALTAYGLGGGEVSVWEATGDGPGGMALRHGGGDRGRADLVRVAEDLIGLEGVAACRVSRWPRRLTVEVGPSGPADLLDRVERVLEACSVAEAPGGDGVEAVSGPARAVNLALAGGSFALTLGALVVPGMPTVPFLLATSYFLARSSPALDARLRRAPWLGQTLQEWEEHGRISRTSKRRLIGLTLVIVAVAVAATPLAPAVLAVIAVMVTINLVGIARMPELESGPASEDRPALAMA